MSTVIDILSKRCDNYTYPWEAMNFASRLTSLSTSKKNIVYIYNASDTSTFRYRVFNMYQLMQNHSEYQVTYFFVGEVKLIFDQIARFDAIIFSRVSWSFAIEQVLQLCRKHRVCTAFDVDDMVFDIDKLPVLIESIELCQSQWDIYFAYVSRMQLLASKCDICIGTNEYLASSMARKFSKPGLVAPNFLNKDQIDLSSQLLKAKPSLSNRITLGYFSGSPSHNRDFDMISGEIAELLHANSNIDLVIVGFLSLAPSLQPFLANGRVKLQPLVNYMKLQVLISQVDINLIPLRLTAFTCCKSELKFFEAGLVKTVSIASPTQVYLDAIQHGVNGYIANEGEWEKTIHEAISKLESSNVQNNACRTAIANYSGERVTSQIEKVYTRLLCYHNKSLSC